MFLFLLEITNKQQDLIGREQKRHCHTDLAGCCCLPVTKSLNLNTFERLNNANTLKAFSRPLRHPPRLGCWAGAGAGGRRRRKNKMHHKKEN